MPKFKVRIVEELRRTVLVEAEDRAEAEEKVNEAYNKEKIVLDYRDFDEMYVDAEEIDSSVYEELAEIDGLETVDENGEVN